MHISKDSLIVIGIDDTLKRKQFNSGTTEKNKKQQVLTKEHKKNYRLV